MYSRGVPVPVIATWCRVDVRRVVRAVDRQIGRDPAWFDACWLVHDQPAWPANRKDRRKTREQVWWEHYGRLAAYVREHGGIPAQNDSREARVLYRWVENQRRNHDAGTLTPDRVEALNRLGEWIGTRRGNADVLWDRRLEEVRQFRAVVGRFPIYDRVRHPAETVLAVWLGRQRTWQRKGRLRPDRHQRLDGGLPGWWSSAGVRAPLPVIGEDPVPDSASGGDGGVGP
ncbi:helicase associated domain-containing protein [Arthrobacter pityocampae]|uniref:helicase associated domain-containing protein n=1 Tax=Arthrobacter pityocampae TaxID=547334 RepID=UPI003736C35D